jgi:acetyl/propionyl-CoA carboxylase alpha subunit
MSDGPELTADDVKEILRLVEDSQFDEFELETPRLSIRFRRGEAADGSGPGAGDAPRAAARGADLAEVTSPLVGTFYRSPSPDAAPFVEVGAAVTADSPVGIVEVMKLMNRVTAGVAGVVVEICRGDGESVQYGDVLLRVEPNAAP